MRCGKTSGIMACSCFGLSILTMPSCGDRLLSSADFFQTVWTQIWPDRTLGLIWIQNLFWEKANFEKKVSTPKKKSLKITLVQ